MRQRLGHEGRPLKRSEQQFWDWFVANEQMLFDFDEENPEPVFEQIDAAMNQVHEDLVFEISHVEQGRREFVISADGVKDLFPAVERLAAAAPDLPRWKVRKYRPRQSPLADLHFGEIRVDTEDIQATLFTQDGELGAILFIPGLPDEQARMRAGFLILDQALGEYDVATKLGALLFASPDEHPEAPRFPLCELPARFDRAVQKR